MNVLKYLKDIRIIIGITILAVLTGSYFYYQDEYKVNLSNGDLMEDFQIKGIDNSPVSLYSIKNKLVLISFWASWCGPCVRETPELVEVYDKFHSQKFRNGEEGFEILSYSLDFDSTRWRNAVAGLDMHWQYHVTEGKAFQSSVARKLNVRAIPTNILIDKNHTIIGVDLDPDQLERILERFKN